MSKFLDPLIVQEIDDSVFQVVDHSFRYQSDLAGLITVPVGFYTDFASVPRIGIIYAALGDTAHEPAVVHDWLYYSAITDKKMADLVLLEAMEVIGISLVKRTLIYWGVKFGGFHAWNQHRKDGHPEAGKFAASLDLTKR